MGIDHLSPVARDGQINRGNTKEIRIDVRLRKHSKLGLPSKWMVTPVHTEDNTFPLRRALAPTQHIDKRGHQKLKGGPQRRFSRVDLIGCISHKLVHEKGF